MALQDAFIGKYCICRSRNEGLNAGIVVAADETGVILKESRRLWYHEPLKKGASWYEAIANSGLASVSKVSEPVEKLIVENYSLTICTLEAEKSIRSLASHEN